MKPLTHVPYREREGADSSFDEELHQSDSEGNEEREEIVEKEEKEEAPQGGVESGAQQQVDYDSLEMVYKNNENEDVERPVKKTRHMKKPSHTRKNSLLTPSREFSVHLKPPKKNKEKYCFNLEEVKKYMDTLEDYENWKKKSEEKPLIEIPNKGCGGGCTIF